MRREVSDWGIVSGVLDATLINSKDAILDAAEMLMARVGYDKASISQICRESKLPVGSIYHHFGSKAGLLSAVIERGVGRFFSALPQPDAGAASAEQAMREYFGAAADAIVENLDFFTLEGDLTRFRRRDPEFARTIATVRERNEQNLTAVIAPLAHELRVHIEAPLESDPGLSAHHWITKYPANQHVNEYAGSTGNPPYSFPLYSPPGE